MNNFNFKRLFLLIKSDAILYRQNITVVVAVIFGALVFGSIFSLPTSVENYLDGAFFVVLIAGLIGTSRSFKDLFDKERAQSYIMIPASIMEKFVAKLLLTLIGFSFGSIIIFYLASIVIASFNLIVHGAQTPIFNPMSENIVHYLIWYLFFHAIFFLGATYFKKSAFTKTILFICLFSLATASFIFTVVITLYGPIFFSGILSFPHYFSTIFNTLLLLLIPGCWLISYLRLSEIEI